MNNFTNLYSKIAESEDSEARRWYIDLSRHLASQMVYFADMLDLVDEEVRKIYPEALQEVLAMLPDGVRIDSSATRPLRKEVIQLLHSNRANHAPKPDQKIEPLTTRNRSPQLPHHPLPCLQSPHIHIS